MEGEFHLTIFSRTLCIFIDWGWNTIYIPDVTDLHRIYILGDTLAKIK